MGIVSLIATSAPSGLWYTLIDFFSSSIANYVWAIVIFTICLKLVLSPLDFFQRRLTAKNARVQAEITPEMEKWQKKLGNNKELLNKKQMELYKKHNYNVTSTCLVMLVYMAVTLVIFITLFNSLRGISSYKLEYQFDQLRAEYYQSLNIDIATAELDAEGNPILKTYQQLIDDVALKTEAEKDAAQQAVVALYNGTEDSVGIKNSWLWVKNIWKSDTITSAISSFEEYKANSGTDLVTKVGLNKADLSAEQIAALEESAKLEYESVMGDLLNYENGYNGTNGYYILTILTVGVSVLSQYLIKLTTGPRKKKDAYGNVIQQPKGKSNLLMMILLPGIMLIFTLTTSAAFAVYVLTNSIMTTALTPVISLISNAIDDRKTRKKEAEQAVTVDYRRK